MARGAVLCLTQIRPHHRILEAWKEYPWLSLRIPSSQSTQRISTEMDEASALVTKGTCAFASALPSSLLARKSMLTSNEIEGRFVAPLPSLFPVSSCFPSS